MVCILLAPALWRKVGVGELEAHVRLIVLSFNKFHFSQQWFNRCRTKLMWRIRRNSFDDKGEIWSVEKHYLTYKHTHTTLRNYTHIYARNVAQYQPYSDFSFRVTHETTKSPKLVIIASHVGEEPHDERLSIYSCWNGRSEWYCRIKLTVCHGRKPGYPSPCAISQYHHTHGIIGLVSWKLETVISVVKFGVRKLTITPASVCGGQSSIQ